MPSQPRSPILRDHSGDQPDPQLSAIGVKPPDARSARMNARTSSLSARSSGPNPTLGKRNRSPVMLSPLAVRPPHSALNRPRRPARRPGGPAHCVTICHEVSCFVMAAAGNVMFCHGPPGLRSRRRPSVSRMAFLHRVPFRSVRPAAGPVGQRDPVSRVSRARLRARQRAFAPARFARRLARASRRAPMTGRGMTARGPLQGVS